MDPQDKQQLQWAYSLRKDRLTVKERALVAMYLHADLNIGAIAKFTHVEAPIVLLRLKRAINKLW